MLSRHAVASSIFDFLDDHSDPFAATNRNKLDISDANKSDADRAAKGYLSRAPLRRHRYVRFASLCTINDF